MAISALAGSGCSRSGVERRRVSNHRARAEGDGQPYVASALPHARDQQGEHMTDRPLRDELVSLIVAGQETTAVTLAWAFGLLIATPGRRVSASRRH